MQENVEDISQEAEQRENSRGRGKVDDRSRRANIQVIKF